MDENQSLNQQLSELGATEFRLDKAGRVLWRRADEGIVGGAGGIAFMTWATTNDTYRWGFHPDYPSLEERPDFVEYLQKETLETTVELATRVCAARGDRLFVGRWATLYVFVTCSGFHQDVDPAIVDQPLEQISPWHTIHGDGPLAAALGAIAGNALAWVDGELAKRGTRSDETE